MKFLLDANMPRAAGAVIRACGHAEEHVRDVGLGDATDDQIEAYARASGAVLVSRDLDFADIRRDIPRDSPGLVALRMPSDSIARDIADVVRRFLESEHLVANLTGRLAILEPSRVRFRPPITG